MSKKTAKAIKSLVNRAEDLINKLGLGHSVKCQKQREAARNKGKPYEFFWKGCKDKKCQILIDPDHTDNLLAALVQKVEDNE